MTQKEFLRLCAHGNREEIEAALDSGADVRKPAYMHGAKVPPLFVAVMEENAEAVSVLLERGADSGDGFIAAVVRGKKKLLKMLIDCGADINAQDRNSHNPLLFAVTADKPKVVKWLIQMGADVNQKSDAGYTALTYAVLIQIKENPTGHSRSVHPEIVASLMKAGADYDEAMIIAVKTGNIDFVRLILENGADINRKCEGEQSPLAAAIFTGDRDINVEMIEFLASNGADVNEVFELGENAITTALNVSVTMNRPDIAGILLSYGADPNFRDATGRTPLVYAVLTGEEILRVLLEHGADPDLPDREGRTPLMLAALDVGAEPGISEALIEHGANVNAQDNDGMTALIWTVAGKDRTPGFLFSALIRTGGLRAEGGNEWFMLAAVYTALKREAQLDSVRLLVKHGADVRMADKNGMNAISCAMMNFDDEMIAVLTEPEKDSE